MLKGKDLERLIVEIEMLKIKVNVCLRIIKVLNVSLYWIVCIIVLLLILKNLTMS